MQALTLQHEHHLCVRKDIFMEVLICAVLMVCSCSFNQMLFLTAIYCYLDMIM